MSDDTEGATMRRTSLFLIIGLALACGSSETGTSEAGAGTAAGGDVSAPSLQELSATAKSCIDLVKAERYAEAISPCERAAAETADARVDQALAEAKQAVKAAAASTAAASAAAALEGESVEDAARSAGEGELKKFGAE